MGEDFFSSPTTFATDPEYALKWMDRVIAGAKPGERSGLKEERSQLVQKIEEIKNSKS